jgi:lipid II:glycine glycyltransferase (peptidoglycan interpeptide bridge formation enzyme)
MGKTSITVTHSTLERFNDLKANTGDESVRELTSDEFIDALLDAWEQNGESVYAEIDVDELIDKLAAEAGGAGVDDSEIARSVVRQFDYAALSDAVADELEGRMR